MSECSSFTITVKDVPATVKKVKDLVTKNGGTFNGDETGGTYKFTGKVKIVFTESSYTITGKYTVAGNKVTITNTVDGLPSCNQVADKMKGELT